MRLFSTFLPCVVAAIFISGCGATVATNWRGEARNSFERLLTSEADGMAADEIDIIRQTLDLADRYYGQEMNEDADRLYQLSCRKSRLLYRGLINSKLQHGATIAVEDPENHQPGEVAISMERVSLHDLLREADTVAAVQPAGKRGHEINPDYTSGPIAEESETKAGRKQKSSARVAGRSRDVGITEAHIPPARKIIYLTFDDGPSRLTLPIASYLKSQGIAATFFVLGNRLKGHEKTITSMLAMGHSVGNHTFSHNLHMLNASFDTDISEVSRTGAMIDRLGGDGNMVRIPYGASDKNLVSKVASEGAQIFEWDIDSRDTTRKGVRNHLFIEKTVQGQLKRTGKRHVVLLFHDGSGHDSTLAAIRDLIPRLKREGYRFGVLASRDRIARASSNQN